MGHPKFDMAKPTTLPPASPEMRKHRLKGKGEENGRSSSVASISRPFDSPRANAASGHVIGVDIGGTNLRIALADMNGAVLAKWSASTRKTSSPDTIVQQISSGTNYLLEQTSISRSSLVAAGVGAPGITNGDAGVVIATSYLNGWKDVPLRSMLESELGIQAAVENDVRLAAIGENWTGAARGIDDFVFLAIGTGIAAGIFANGKLVHGTNWAAGEIGYMHVPGVSDQAAKQGEPGPLESMIGGEGIRQQWLQCCNGIGPPRACDLTATEIFEHAGAGDSLAATVLQRSARILAYAVYNISLVLNCKLFVLGGGVGMSAPLLDATQRVLEQYNVPARPELIISSLGHDAQLVGAIRLALNQPQSHTIPKT
jgi:glucokinase